MPDAPTGTFPRSPLDLDADTMRRLGYMVTDVVAQHLSTLRQQRVFDTLPRRATERLIAAPPPARGTDIDTMLAWLGEHVFAHAAREPHPGFMAYVPGCPTFPAALGDWLATGYNFFAGVWPVASGPNADRVAGPRLVPPVVGHAGGSSGLLTTGGSAANLTAIDRRAPRRRGRRRRRAWRASPLYTSDQTHSAAIRAAWIAGIRAHTCALLPTR